MVNMSIIFAHADVRKLSKLFIVIFSNKQFNLLHTLSRVLQP